MSLQQINHKGHPNVHIKATNELFEAVCPLQTFIRVSPIRSESSRFTERFASQGERPLRRGPLARFAANPVLLSML
jgi:hypothetical protein